MLAGSYQMQYTSQGPLGMSASYLKNAILPDIFLGTECKTEHWTTGVGIDAKNIKPSVEKLSSASIVAYTQLINTKFQFKAKALLGQNLTDYVIPCGYGVSDTTATGTPKSFTNLNMISTWMNAVYGTKLQVGIFLGYSQNLGASQALILRNGKYTVYGYGVYNQIMLNRMYRVAPHLSYNLPNLKFGLEYDLTATEYGNLQSNGRVTNPYIIKNHRVVSSVSYFF
jgi:hypothetical protein